jgi:hypothetical protein
MRLHVFTALLLAGALPAGAQAAPPERGTWLDASLGGGNTGLNVGVGITRRSGIHGLTVRGLVAAQLRFVIFGKTTVQSFADLGLLYGLHGRSGSTLYVARAGVGAVWYRREDLDSTVLRDVNAEFGVPWEAGVTRLFGNNFGLGVRLAGNVNSAHDNIAGLLVLHLGQAY